MELIPYELVQLIYTYLMPRDSLRLSLVCHWLRQYCPMETLHVHNIMAKLHSSHQIISHMSHYVSLVSRDSIIFKPNKIIYYFTDNQLDLHVHGSKLVQETMYVKDIIILCKRIGHPHRRLYRQRWDEAQFELIRLLLHASGVEVIIEE